MRIGLFRIAVGLVVEDEGEDRGEERKRRRRVEVLEGSQNEKEREDKIENRKNRIR